MDPRFIHDCDRCLFLGKDNDHDYYICIGDYFEATPTLLARFGNEGHEYLSSWISTVQSLLEHGWMRDNSQIPGDSPEIQRYPLVKAYRLAENQGFDSLKKKLQGL